MEVIHTLLKWRKFIFCFVVVAVVASTVVSLVLPVWYKSTAAVLPPRNQGLLGGLSGLSVLLKEVAPSAASRVGGQASSYSYMAILKSRMAAEAMIQKFNLSEVYRIDDRSMEKTLKEFWDNFDIEVSDDGAILVSVYDKDPTRAAQMANYAVQQLNEISIELGTREARNNREFLEGRVEDTKNELGVAEDLLKEFQERHGLVLIPDEARALATSIGEFYARKVRTEIELAILKKTAGAENPLVAQLQTEHLELTRKLATFPELGVRSFRLYRDVIIQQKILEFIVPLYEQARFEELRDTPVIVVLDQAVPAEKKARPRRAFIVAGAFLSSVIVSFLIALLVERYKELTMDPRFQDVFAFLKRKS